MKEAWSMASQGGVKYGQPTTRLGAAAKVDQGIAAAMLLDALQRGGTTREAAKLLAVGERTMREYKAKLGLKGIAAEIRTMHAAEKQSPEQIKLALLATGGSKLAAAKLLSLNDRQLGRQLDRHGLQGFARRVLFEPGGCEISRGKVRGKGHGR